MRWHGACRRAAATSVLRGAAEPFSADGGLALLTGNLGRSVIKVSAVPDDRHVIEAPAACSTPGGLQAAFKGRRAGPATSWPVRFQGPRQRHAELQLLTPPLAVLQAGLQGGAGHRRPHERRLRQGAGGHPRQPEALAEGRWRACATATASASTRWPARSRIGRRGRVAARAPATIGDAAAETNAHGLGRELFGGLRRNAERRTGRHHLALIATGCA